MLYNYSGLLRENYINRYVMCLLRNVKNFVDMLQSQETMQ